MKIEKGEDSAFISEAADRLTPFGGPVKFKKFHESPALAAQNSTSVSLASSSSSEDEEECILGSTTLSIIPHQIPHPSVPPRFCQDQVILNI